MGMDIQADMLFNSTLPPGKFEKERGIVIEEIGKGADRPSTQVNNHFSKTLFSGTPYERPVLGTVSTITHLKRDDVLEYYHNWYVPNNMTLMVIGDFTTTEMVELVKKKYGPYPAGHLPEHKQVLLTPPKTLKITRANGMGNFLMIVTILIWVIYYRRLRQRTSFLYRCWPIFLEARKTRFWTSCLNRTPIKAWLIQSTQA